MTRKPINLNNGYGAFPPKTTKFSPEVKERLDLVYNKIDTFVDDFSKDIPEMQGGKRTYNLQAEDNVLARTTTIFIKATIDVWFPLKTITFEERNFNKEFAKTGSYREFLQEPEKEEEPENVS